MAPDHQPRQQPSLLYAVKQVELAVRARLDELAKPHGITALQYTALTVLDRASAPLSQAELARLSFVRPQSMSDVLAGLLRRELITRRADERNRRRLLITLTPAGRALLDAIEPAARRLEDEMLDGITAAQRATFASALAAARRNLSGSGPS